MERIIFVRSMCPICHLPRKGNSTICWNCKYDLEVKIKEADE